MSTSIFGPAYTIEIDEERVLTQMEVIRDVLLSAAECAEIAATFRQPNRLIRESAFAENVYTECDPEPSGWMTLLELAELTGYGEASISAQLRHLRKERFGSYIVRKRRRGPRKSDGIWEYRIVGRNEAATYMPLFAGASM